MKNKDDNNHKLWVEKYSPKNFIDLLSDDVKYEFSLIYVLKSKL